MRVGDRRREVRRARSARHKRDADAAARLRVALGGMARARLVADEDVADGAVVQRVVDGQARASGQPEDAVGAFALERGDQPVCAAHRACRAEAVRTVVSTSMLRSFGGRSGRDEGAREARRGLAEGQPATRTPRSPPGRASARSGVSRRCVTTSNMPGRGWRRNPLDLKCARGSTVAPMYAIRLHEFGSAGNLRWEEVDDPVPARARCSSTSLPPASTSSTRRSAAASRWDPSRCPTCPPSRDARWRAPSPRSVRAWRTPGRAAASSRISVWPAAATPSGRHRAARLHLLPDAVSPARPSR